MARGGARNRSGPSPDPQSLRSAERNYSLTALPREGYEGDVPDFPLQPIVLFAEYFEGTGKDRVKVKERDDGETESFREREAEVWAEAWTTPQACAWSLQSWRWPVVAEYCRLKSVVEFDPSASAALVAQLHRYRDQIGLTPAGLKENGWAISTEAAADPDAAPAPETVSQPSARDRIKVVPDVGVA
jgi:hypothetical protein